MYLEHIQLMMEMKFGVLEQKIHLLDLKKNSQWL